MPHFLRLALTLRVGLSPLRSPMSRLQVSHSESATVGEATNLMSNDCERIYEAQLFLHYMWASPAYVVVVLVLATRSIGPAALVGFGLLVLLLPLQIHLGRSAGKAKRTMLPETDARTELFTQILSGIQVTLNNIHDTSLSDISSYDLLPNLVRII